VLIWVRGGAQVLESWQGPGFNLQYHHQKKRKKFYVLIMLFKSIPDCPWAGDLPASSF
jgi:hypothetical protein